MIVTKNRSVDLAWLKSIALSFSPTHQSHTAIATPNIVVLTINTDPLKFTG